MFVFSPRADLESAEALPRYALYNVSLGHVPVFLISPGVSFVPANKLPTTTADAPAAIALAISPGLLQPPLAIIATPEE